MKIRKLHLKNIGVFDWQPIEFEACKSKDKAEIHIFTGQNGSGKSTILMALASSFNYFGEVNKIQTQRVQYLSNNFLKRFRLSSKPAYISTVSELNETTQFRTVIRSDDISESIVGSHEPYDFYYKLTESDATPNYESLRYAVFAFSGYRQIKSERIEAIKQLPNFNPLYQSLEFIKDYTNVNQLTVNQLIANNISNRALAKEDNSFEEVERYTKVIEAIEKAICEIVGYEIKFVLKRQPNELKLRVRGEELDFDVLPDGLRSLISWMADLLGRVDLLKWQDDLPINEKNLILFLDEIEVHLHPAWQRKVLPVVQKLFKNSQIFISTHSPFVVNSVDDAWVYKLDLDDNGKAHIAGVVRSEDGHSYSHVLSEIFDIKEEFGIEVQKHLAKFKELRNKILASKNGSEKTEKELRKLAKTLADQSEELQTIVEFELRQINKRTGKSLSI